MGDFPAAEPPPPEPPLGPEVPIAPAVESALEDIFRVIPIVVLRAAEPYWDEAASSHPAVTFLRPSLSVLVGKSYPRPNGRGVPTWIAERDVDAFEAFGPLVRESIGVLNDALSRGEAVATSAGTDVPVYRVFAHQNWLANPAQPGYATRVTSYVGAVEVDTNFLDPLPGETTALFNDQSQTMFFELTGPSSSTRPVPFFYRYVAHARYMLDRLRILARKPHPDGSKIVVAKTKLPNAFLWGKLNTELEAQFAESELSAVYELHIDPDLNSVSKPAWSYSIRPPPKCAESTADRTRRLEAAKADFVARTWVKLVKAAVLGTKTNVNVVLVRPPVELNRQTVAVALLEKADSIKTAIPLSRRIKVSYPDVRLYFSWVKEGPLTLTDADLAVLRTLDENGNPPTR